MRRSQQSGFTLVEIMIVVAIIALLAAIAIPNILRGRTTANESSAIGNIRALVSSLEMYRSVYNEYPDDWDLDMYTNANPAFGPGTFNGDMNTADAVDVQGFQYGYDRLTEQTYVLNANPVTPNRTGTRSFWATEDGQIQHCTGQDNDLTGPNGAAVPIDQAVANCT